MTYIEQQERNLLWAASQGLLAPSPAASRLERAGLVTLSRVYEGLIPREAYVLTCAGAARLNELDRKG